MGGFSSFLWSGGEFHTVWSERFARRNRTRQRVKFESSCWSLHVNVRYDAWKIRKVIKKSLILRYRSYANLVSPVQVWVTNGDDRRSNRDGRRRQRTILPLEGRVALHVSQARTKHVCGAAGRTVGTPRPSKNVHWHFPNRRLRPKTEGIWKYRWSLWITCTSK